MFERIYRQACECIRLGNYVVTLHAEEEMTADGLNIFDVEEAVLNGSIFERQKDTITGEWKYLIRGRSLTGIPLTVAAKLGKARKLIIITVYGLRPTNGKLR